MINAHAPFQDGSKHAANEYCPVCHGPFDPKLWDSNGKYRPEAQESALHYSARTQSDADTKP
jgi:hypothetical protein